MDQLDTLVAHDAGSEALLVPLRPVPRSIKLIGRLPHPSLADSSVDLTSVHVILAIDNYGRVLASTLLRDQGDVAG